MTTASAELEAMQQEQEYVRHFAVANRQAKAALRQVMAYRGLNTSTLSRLVGLSRQHVQGYTSGESKLTAGHLGMFGQVLDVPGYVLAMEPDEALKWTIDHAPNPADEVIDMADRRSYKQSDVPRSRKACFTETASHDGWPDRHETGIVLPFRPKAWAA